MNQVCGLAVHNQNYANIVTEGDRSLVINRRSEVLIPA
jgi:hypothetical protein